MPITFGLTAATWLVGLVEARAALDRVATERLAVQLGGAAGTLAPLGDHGVAVMEHLADRLGLAAPALPWATSRGGSSSWPARWSWSPARRARWPPTSSA